MKKIIPLLVSILFVTPVYAQTISIGVSPSSKEINIYGGNSLPIKFEFVNPEGDTDAYYEILFYDNLADYSKCYGEYLCGGEEFLVPKGTTFGNGVKKSILFKCNNKNEVVDTGFYVYGRAVTEEEEGIISLKKRIGVNIKINCYGEHTTTSTTVLDTITTTTTLPQTTTTTQSGSWFIPPIILPIKIIENETPISNPIEDITTTTITEVIINQENIEDKKEELEETIKSEEDELPFAYWAIFPVLGILALIGIGLYYFAKKRNERPNIPDWQSSKILLIFLLFSLLLIPRNVVADDINVTLDVTTEVEAPIGIAGQLTRIGQGTGGLIEQISSPITVFIILIGIIGVVGSFIVGIILRILEW